MNQTPCVALALLLLAAGCASGTEPSPSTGTFTDSGPDAEELREAYAEAFDEACEEVWSNSPDGNVYYAGVAYTEDECKDAKDETEADDAADVDEAAERGREAGFDAAFDLSPAGILCHGRDCWSRSDF